MLRKRETVARPVAVARHADAREARVQLWFTIAIVAALMLIVGTLMAGCSSPADQNAAVGAGSSDQASSQSLEDAAQSGANGGDDAAGNTGTGEEGAQVEAGAEGDGGEADVDAAAGDAEGGEEVADQEGLVELDVTPPPVIDNVAFVEGDEVVDLPESNHVLLGQPAPDFTMTVLETGEEVSLSDYAGKPVVVNFWATWCPPCLLEMPFFEAVYQQHQGDDLVVIAIDAGERVPESLVESTIRRFVDSRGLSFPVVFGENAYDVQTDYSVGGLPATYLIDRDGVVVGAHQGAYPNEATLADHVTRILGGDGEG
ncbi:MAG: TlpA family protein disulfide reductase [Anaerolineae bacterium]